MLLKGKAHIFGNDVSTDDIIASKYKSSTTDMAEMSKYLMGNVDPDFVRRIAPGDFIVAGSNFGCGSSRETAPRVIKLAGLSAVRAKGFARIFFRNAINVGLPVIVCKEAYDQINEHDIIEIDVTDGVICCEKDGQQFTATKLPDHVMKILAANGLIEYLNKQ